MPCSYSILPERGLVRVTGTGVVGLIDLKAVFGWLRDDPAFSGHLDSLWDFGRVETTDLDASSVRTLTRLPRLFDHGSRRAVVVRTDLGYGLTRMFQILGGREGEDFAIFRSLDEAEDWLG